MKFFLGLFLLFSVASADNRLRVRQLVDFGDDCSDSAQVEVYCCCKNKNTIGQQYDNYLIDDDGKTKCVPAGYVLGGEDGDEIGAGLGVDETMLFLSDGCWMMRGER